MILDRRDPFVIASAVNNRGIISGGGVAMMTASRSSVGAKAERESVAPGRCASRRFHK
jgi:hypothetical protein